MNRAVCSILLVSFLLLGALAQSQNQIVNVGNQFTSNVVTSVAPGVLITLTTPNLNVPDATASTIPLPSSLSGVSVLVRAMGAKDTTGYPTSLPILNIYSTSSSETSEGVLCGPSVLLCSYTQITVQIPTEGVCAPRIGSSQSCGQPLESLPPLIVLNVKANGVTGPDLPLQVQNFFSHPLQSCDPVLGRNTGACSAEVIHADGTFVTADSTRPAKVGEVISVYAIGLLMPQIASGSASATPIELDLSNGVMNFTYTTGISPPVRGPLMPGQVFGLSSMTFQSVVPEWVGLIPGFVGLFQINIRVPPVTSGTLVPCGSNGNTTLAFGQLETGALYICVQP
jgi:hypothetical protein